MAKKGTKKCALCNQFVNADETTLTLQGTVSCYACQEQIEERPSTAICFSDTGRSAEERFTEEFGIIGEGDLPEPIKRQYWKRTDGWRGHTEWELKSDYVRIADGWVTGWPERWMIDKIALSDFYKQLHSCEVKPPVDFWWVFGVTSNVFSTVLTLVCKAEDKEKLIAWLDDTQMWSVDRLNNALS